MARVFNRPKIYRDAPVIIIVAACSLLLAACGSGDQQTAQKKLSPVDACALVTVDEVHALAPDVSPGHPSATKIPNVYTCQWDDSRHLPQLMLQVTLPDPAGVKQGLESGMANMGYTITSVSGLGDEAAVAVQQANPKFHTKAGVAILSIRVGNRQLAFSPVGLDITGTGTAAFTQLKTLAGQAVKRLKALDH